MIFIVIKKLFDKPIIQSKFNIHSIRYYGQPKLSKPTKLKGIKQSFSIDYIPKRCKCAVFIVGKDIWIHHKDYFSSSMELPYSELGAPLGFLVAKYTNKTKSNKFIYGDAWGDIVLRNEAWLHIENIILDIESNIFQLDIVNAILRQMEQHHNFEIYDLCSTDMERFFENVVKELVKFNQTNNNKQIK